MFGFIRRCLGLQRPPREKKTKQEKSLNSRLKRAVKKQVVLRALLRRQSNRRQETLRDEVNSCADFISVYADSPSGEHRIPIQERIDGLSSLYHHMKRLERSMEKHKLGLVPWMIQSFGNYRALRAHKRDQARERKQEEIRMDAIPFLG